MAEDIDKLIGELEDWALYSKSFLPGRTVAAVKSLRSRVSELEAERDAAVLAASPSPPAAEGVGGGDRRDFAMSFIMKLAHALQFQQTSYGDGLSAAQIEEAEKLIGEELQRERGAVAGRGGELSNCALKGTGPAAFTVSDDQVSTGGRGSRLPQESALPTRLPGKEILGSGVANDSGEYPEAQAQCSNAGAPGKAEPSLLSPASDDQGTSEFKPDWELTPQEQIAVTLNLALTKVPAWPGCTDEQLDALAEAVLSSPPVRAIVGALEAWRRWEADIILHADWSSGCAHLTQDQHDALSPIQEQRESILSRFQSVGGEQHDHADGTSVEAVEKVTQPE